eukprot:scaffold252960_cov19-Prasinocladus_malaysianus.AAC.1
MRLSCGFNLGAQAAGRPSGHCAPAQPHRRCRVPHGQLRGGLQALCANQGDRQRLDSVQHVRYHQSHNCLEDSNFGVRMRDAS